MDNPNQYCKNNDLQRRDAGDVIAKYIHLIRWNPSGGDECLDIGTGTGEVLWELLRTVLPDNYGKLIGCDISEAMVKYANTHYAHPKVEFIELDISMKNPDNFRKKFHHVFSFYCLHWVHDQRLALQNIFDLLKPGGDMLVMYVGSHLVCDIYVSQSKLPKFKPYMMDVQNFVVPYQNVQNTEQVLRKTLEDIGFQVTLCENQHTVYEYKNFDGFLNGMVTLNPFIKRMPDPLKAQYILHLKNELFTAFLDENKDAKCEKFTTSYKMIVLCASKFQ